MLCVRPPPVHCILQTTQNAMHFRRVFYLPAMPAHPVRAKLNQLGVLPRLNQQGVLPATQHTKRFLYRVRSSSLRAAQTACRARSPKPARSQIPHPRHQQKRAAAASRPPFLVLVAGSHPKRQKKKTLFKIKNKKANNKIEKHINSTALVYKNTSTLISVNSLLGIGQVSTVLTASRAA